MKLRQATDVYHARMFIPAEQGGHWQRWDVEPHLPEGVALGVAAVVEVNDGRWIAKCPTHAACGGAQLVTEGQDRFFCVECLNGYCNGAWIGVQWPEDPPAIEAELVKRSSPGEMNWRPGETLEDLRGENREHGVR